MSHDVKKERNFEAFNVHEGGQHVEIDREGRETWKGKFDFLMTLIGFSVGVGNLWRFPYLCYKNGGGVFLIPYFTVLFGAGIPLLFLEVSLGQFTSFSGVSSWNIYPLVKCLGVATTTVVFYLNLYYIVVIAWGCYYLYSCFTFGDLPWTKCQPSFGDACDPNSNMTGQTGLYVNLFWERHVLGLSRGFEEIGSIQPHMAVSLLVAWIIVYACIIKGVQWTGKIVYFTGLFPYLMLVILFIRGITLDGAWNGIMFYIKPDFSKLLEGQVWLDAGTQVFFSMSLGIGAMQTLGSYNKFKHDCLTDCVIYAIVNSCTSMFGGLCIFSVLGYMAKQMDVPVSEVTAGGPGLTFIAYPTALSLMPAGTKVMTALFFLMLIFLGLDSQFVGVEGFTSQFMDAFPSLFKFKHSRGVFITGTCMGCYLVGLLFVTEGGMYYFQIMDFYSASGIVLLFICFAESVTIAYLYGGRRYMDDLKYMLGITVPLYFPVCWFVVTPLMCFSVGFGYYLTLTDLQYGSYIFPKWTEYMGWTITSSTCLIIPVGVMLQIFLHRNNTRVLTTALLKPHQVHSKTLKPYTIATPRKY